VTAINIKVIKKVEIVTMVMMMIMLATMDINNNINYSNNKDT